MTIGSLFSGIGGLELGLERAGLGPILFQVENDPFCLSVLARHWPTVPRFTDVREVGSELPRVDVLCGGFPCQDVSSAGKGAGLSGERSGLWREFWRLVKALAPAWVVVENVASGARRWLPFVRRDLHMLGYRTRALALSAEDVGAPHLRRRVFVLAADPHRVSLRDESGWRGGPTGQGPDVPRHDGQEGNVAHPGCEGLEERSEQQARAERQAAERGGVPDDPWAVEPNVGRAAHGVPSRVDRLRALGNAVVPQCAEAIGRVIVATEIRSTSDGS